MPAQTTLHFRDYFSNTSQIFLCTLAPTKRGPSYLDKTDLGLERDYLGMAHLMDQNLPHKD